jgi:DNA-binding response OmpR family regulator
MGYALGAAAFMTKPIDRVELLRVLNKYRDSHPKSILVVEDDSASAEMIARALSEENWDVRIAPNGRVGIELLEQRAPTLILLDLMMPLMDGFEFAAEIRKQDRFRAIPIIVVTSKDLTDDERNRLNGDVQRIVKKSGMTPHQILSEVRATLHRRLEAETEESEKQS